MNACTPCRSLTPYRFLADTTDFVDLDASHLDEAAHLFRDAHALLRGRVPALPAGPGEPARVREQLDRALGSGPGIAAVRDGRLVGYMASLAVPGLRGPGTTAYCPAWGHAAAGPGRPALYLRMYERIAAAWLGRRWSVECLTLPAGDPEVEELFRWLGFGLFSLDMILGLPAAIEQPPEPSACVVERATVADVDELMPLVRAHDAYYRRSPVFLDREADTRGDVAERIGRPNAGVWIARAGGRIEGFCSLAAPAGGSSPFVRDEATIYIDGAWVNPATRGRGAGTALVAAISRWATDRGFERLAVDCESANPLAARFWLRFFTLFGISVERHVDERLVSGGAR